ncbi:M48 family metalloprotease [Phytoactinopolyspora mesophila]|uniref:M48 family metalloprotease n=1 Tax=Phytoactinopolyspora mesophila TaxID=2650750 RepID=UPI001C9E83B2
MRTTVLLLLPSLGVVLIGSRFGTLGFWLALIAAAAFCVYVLLRSDTVAVRAMRAYPVGEAEQPVFCRVVRESTTKARLPMPQLYVSPTRAVNALATGRNPNRSMICVTEGALAVLDENELRAVVGHELAHIRNLDTLPASVVGAVNRLAVMVPLVGVFLAGAARLAISRDREFKADSESARLNGEPLALAGALRKFDAAARELVLPPEAGVVAASHLMLTSPLRYRGLLRLCRSHPSTAERVARLEQLAGYRR